MAYNPSILGYTDVAEQTSWETAETSGNVVLATKPALPGVQRTMYEHEALAGRFYVHRPIEGPQSEQTLALSIPNLQGVSSSIPSAAPTAHGESMLFKSLLGGRSAPQGYDTAVVVASGSTSSSIKIDYTELADPTTVYRPGDAVIFSDGGSPATYAIGWIKSITDGGGAADHTLTLFEALPFTPGNGTGTWGTVTCYADTADPTFLTVRTQSADSNSRVVHEGCVVESCKIDLAAGGMVSAEFGLRYNSSAASSNALTSYAYTYPFIPPAFGANGARATLGGSAVALQSCSINIAQTITGRRNHNNNQGIAGWLAANRTYTVETTRLIASAAPIFTLPSATSLMFQFGTTPGNMMGILVPVADLQEVGAVADADGFWAQSYTYRANRYAGDTGSLPANSEFRVCFG